MVVAYGSGRLQELLITEFKWQFKQGFAMLVITWTGHLWEWSKESFNFLFLFSIGQHFELITATSANIKTYGEVGHLQRKA